MTDAQGSPCLGCSIDHDCCTRMRGLKLSKDEFERHFKRHAEGLSVKLSGQVFVVSAQEGSTCPHWKDGGCSIDHAKPIECRLFPYTIDDISEKPNQVVIGFHSETDCPAKDRLLLPESEARKLIASFGRSVFGEETAFVIYHARKTTTACWRRATRAARARLFPKPLAG